MAALLETQDLHATYGEIEALHGIDLAIERGSIVALLGANGAGKTSTLRAVTGMVKTAGSVTFDGAPLRGIAPEDAAMRGIAHVPEGRGTLSALTVWENLTLGAFTQKKRSETRRCYENAIGYFPWIEKRRDQPAGTLSGGEQQMLAIARALMMCPKLLLLDEPSLGLAPLIVRQIFEILRAINQRDGVTIVVAEQNATIALQTADFAYVLETGRVAVSGASSDLASNDLIRRSYLGY
jgi:branched-chain amino acid transport system ATP-binding protein